MGNPDTSSYYPSSCVCELVERKVGSFSKQLLELINHKHKLVTMKVLININLNFDKDKNPNFISSRKAGKRHKIVGSVSS